VNGCELRQHLRLYLELRNAIGFPVRDNRLLDNFVWFVSSRCDSNSIPVNVVSEWLDFQSCAATGKARRLSVVRPFLDYLSCCAPEIQRSLFGLFRSPSRSKPFVFERTEIEQMLSVAERFGPRDSFFRVTLHTLLGLLACTGLRVSEALSLDRNDVMPIPNSQALYIRETKFRKTRIVPVHPSAAKTLATYAGHRMLLGYDWNTTAFFVSDAGERLSYRAVATAFRDIVEELKLKARDGSRQPTIHSLRHTFVMNRLLRWHSEKVDVHTRLAHLATYLGHVDFSCTYWYVSCLPSLLGAAADAFTAPGSLEVQA